MSQQVALLVEREAKQRFACRNESVSGLFQKKAQSKKKKKRKKHNLLLLSSQQPTLS
jgi:hypothetical protein